MKSSLLEGQNTFSIAISSTFREDKHIDLEKKVFEVEVVQVTCSFLTISKALRIVSMALS